jgi:hypothetical protein
MHGPRPQPAIVVCAGATPRATLYAAYALLERLGACRRERWGHSALA